MAVAQMAMNGARLAYFAVPLEKTLGPGAKLQRKKHKYIKGKGIVSADAPVDPGYMVYFPRGTR